MLLMHLFLSAHPGFVWSCSVNVSVAKTSCLGTPMRAPSKPRGRGNGIRPLESGCGLPDKEELVCSVVVFLL